MDVWRELEEISKLVLYRGNISDEPQDYTAVLGSATGMFPSPSRECLVNSASGLTILACMLGSEPGVDHQARTRVQLIWLGRQVYVMNAIEEGSRRNLGLLTGSALSTRIGSCHRVHGHLAALLVCHDGCRGLRVVLADKHEWVKMSGC